MTSNEFNWIEESLKLYDIRNCIDKVVSVQYENNYSESIFFLGKRAKIEVILNSGRKQHKSVIVKRLLVEENDPVSNQVTDFRKEMQIYGSVLPSMENLMDEIEDTRIFWHKIIHCDLYSEIILEDSKTNGYDLSKNAHKGLDSNEASMVMKRVGAFHAMSLILKDRGMIDMNDYEHIDDNKVNIFFKYTFVTLSRLIVKEWGQQWIDIGIRLRKASDRILKFTDNNGFKVLNHGNLQAKNVLLKYIDGTVTPVDLLLFNFKNAVYTNYTYDLITFLYSSLADDIKKNQFTTLLQIYHDNLSSTLKKFEFSELQRIPTCKDVIDEMEKTMFYALITVIAIMPIAKSNSAFDFSYFCENPSEYDKLLKSNECVACLKDCLLKFYYKNIF